MHVIFLNVIRIREENKRRGMEKASGDNDVQEEGRKCLAE